MSVVWKLEAPAVLLVLGGLLQANSATATAQLRESAERRPATNAPPVKEARPTGGALTPLPRAAALTSTNRAALQVQTNKISETGQKILKAGIPAFQLLTNDCVAFIGGTSTVGEARHAFLETLLTRRYPGYRLRFRNLGWEADTVFQQERPLNFPSLVQSVKEQKATLIFANFGLMESVRGPEGLTEFSRAYNALLDEFTNVTPRIVLLSPFRHERQRSSSVDVAERNKNLEPYVRAIRSVAEKRELLFVDLFKLQARESDSDGSMTLTLDGIHPSTYGYWRAAYEIERGLGLPQPEWIVEVDARNRSYQTKGTQLADFQVSTSTVRFQSLDEALPGPAFRRSDGSISVWGSRTLRVSGLLPGRYILKIDGVPLYEQGQLFWEQGRALTHGPEIKQSEALRELIVQKNNDFFNYWRPQNWAFLNGDLISQPSSHRHDSFSDRWFPGEMLSFVPLIAKSETNINNLAKSGFHVYELRRVE